MTAELTEEGLIRHRETLQVMQRWIAIFNAGGRTVEDFAPLNPDLDYQINLNSVYLSQNYDPDLAEMQDRIIRARAQERSSLAQSVIGPMQSVREDVQGVYKDAKDFFDRHAPTGGQLTIGVVAIAVVVVVVFAFVLKK